MFKVYEFHWKAVNRFQQKQKGKLLAQNQEELEQRLIKKDFSKLKLVGILFSLKTQNLKR